VSIVDDDDPVRDSTRALLESFGYSVRCYSSPAAFLDDPQAEGSDCLILDLHMPLMSGLELLEQLRDRKIQTPAILLTANGERLNARAKQAKVLAILRKPVPEDVLLKWVRTACTGKSD
jgi:FixJ family two-component response regulator